MVESGSSPETVQTVHLGKMMSEQVVEPPVVDDLDGPVEESDLVPVANRFLAERPLRYEDITDSVIGQSGTSAVAQEEARKEVVKPITKVKPITASAEAAANPSVDAEIRIPDTEAVSITEGQPLPALEPKEPEQEEEVVAASEEESDMEVTRRRRRRRRR